MGSVIHMKPLTIGLHPPFKVCGHDGDLLKNSCTQSPRLKRKSVYDTNVEHDFIAVQREKSFKTKLQSVVTKHTGTTLYLNNCPDFPFTVCDQNGTNYRHMTSMMGCWNNLFLEEEQDMTVIGRFDNVPSLALGLQWVVLVTADGAVYGYENERMCLLASSLQELFLKGPQFGGESLDMDLSDVPQDPKEFEKACREMGIESKDAEVDAYFKSLESEYAEMDAFFSSLHA